MQITITPTDQLTNMEGVQVRVWEGVSDAGVKCLVFVHRLAVHNDQNQEQFDRELIEQLPPGRTVSLRQIV